jgi:DNA-binding transcriptional LysR family regulator
VAPVVSALQRRHPALDVELRCHDRILDMVAERIDVAVRMLAAPPAEFVARALGDDRRGLFASPAYLRRAGTPSETAELSRHASITYSGGSAARLPRRGRVVFATDSVLAAREAGRAGLGIVELPEYLASADVAAGSLREVVPGAIPATRKVYAIYFAHRHLSANVRVLIDALVRRA